LVRDAFLSIVIAEDGVSGTLRRSASVARSRHEHDGHGTTFLLPLPPCGQCPGDSVRPGATCPLRSPFTLLEFDTANVARLPAADTGRDHNS